MAASTQSRPRGSGRGRRVTIADIAERAGVTSAAVSLAVNGRPGVSDATRARIMDIARELQWEPSPAARALAGAPVLTVGMVLARPAEVLGTEAFFGAFVAGLQEVLSRHDYSLQMKIVDSTEAEIATYRRWLAQRRVDGVIVVDLRQDDPRIPALEDLALPALVVGGPGHHGSLPSVYVDDAHATRLLVDHLAERGHRRIARVAGNEDFLHILLRDRAFTSRCEELGVAPVVQNAGFGAHGAEVATAALLAREDAPTALIFDSDEMALAGCHVLEESGRRIPQDVAVASYEDSALTLTHRPPITAIGRSAIEYGRVAANRLLEVVAAADAPRGTSQEARVIEPSLIVRDSTAQAPEPWSGRGGTPA
ncbi:LacI family DNA-binding transcriptional regulator [Brachybacterium saurashtrense]|uniref:LacI family transcriptional regulator n=1 Tax=Brachybacterium saurashtrense TaxID=556288 RepID=A0A345YMN9_9MICO|nr:LacI family DNA-binding transcriptional regulator [Brachybacterium saurashtrense]AXK45191.1 LacI family transcriptional regulator [Brachybacterium saurashtrense]RRR22055.1 LacI family transcriptional regulator [Brachybacterium saurashtrense]